MIEPLRGHVYLADLGHGPKPWLIVSNNSRNRNLATVLAARISTTGKNAHLPTVVALGPAESVRGYVLCDDLWQLYRDEDLASHLGSLTPAAMVVVNAGLRSALALP